MDPVLYLIAAVVVSLLLYFVNKGHQKQEERRPRPRPVQVSNDGPAGRRHGARRRGIGSRVQEARNFEDQTEEIEKKDESGEEEEVAKTKIGTKKLRKIQEKEQKRLAREQEEKERAERKKRQEEKDAEIQKKKQEEELAEKREEEEAERLRLEKEQREHEEYLKLKSEFCIEEEGEEEAGSDEDEHENMLQEFIEYLKETKVILLEDLASHFGLRVQDAIDRVQSLLDDEIITGVIDDRGKFIYISIEELENVARYINKEGRISLCDLARVSSTLINLGKDESIKLAQSVN